MKAMKYWPVMISLLLIGVLLSGPQQLNGHQYKVPLVIDTDMGLDDARALVMLLNRDMADIRLIVASDGAVSPVTGYKNIKTLLALFPKLETSSIQVAAGRDLHKKAPAWRKWSKNIFLFHQHKTKMEGMQSKEMPPNASQAIIDALHNAESPCVYLCLGPMTSLAAALEKDASIKNKISRVIYYGSAPTETPADWNTSYDMDAAGKVFASGLTIYKFVDPSVDPLPFDQQFFQKIKALDTPGSRLMVKLHSLPSVVNGMTHNHFRIWDEMTVIYMEQPGLFTFTAKNGSVHSLKPYKKEKVLDSYLKLLGHYADGHIREREVVVLNAFPTQPESFKTDIGPHVRKIIEKYGLEEWKACVLTNELHRHLGIYSLIGAKMGIRAREELDAPLDGLQVVSYAGSVPPLSCMNDGLQVSTGASLGRGTIRIDSEKTQPAACFIYKKKKITLILKNEVIQQIKKDIAEAIKKFGGITPEYFAHIRELSIRYWFTLDRMQIFELKHQD